MASPSNFGSLLIPRLFALKDIQPKYMRCESEGDIGGLLFSENANLYEPRTRFEAEPTRSRRVVHIRCTFNNKYLRRDSISSFWIKASATNTSEDRSQWDCTMFEVLPAKEGGGQIQLRHIQLGYYLGSYVKGLQAVDIMPSGSEKHLNFTFFDWSTLAILPRFLAFKCANGRYYLGKVPSSKYFEFKYTDKGVTGVTMEVVPASDGNVYIKAGTRRCSSYWARCTSCGHITLSDGSELERFQLVKDGTNRISIKHLDSNKFCTSNKKRVCEANTSSLTEGSKLVVEEAVKSRTLEIEWRLQDARLYNVMPYELKSSTHDNHSPSPVPKLITLSYETAETTSFNTSHTWDGGIKTSIHTPSVPFITGDANIEMSAKYGGSYTWGESKTTTSRSSENATYTIPARTRLVVQMMSTKGYCDVPYNYTQIDHLFDGNVISTYKEDGVFTGINCFNIHTSNREEALP